MPSTLGASAFAPPLQSETANQTDALRLRWSSDCAVAANVTQTRALVASLEAAVAFVRALSGALPVLVQLLASATVSDVHDSIALLMTYSRFGIAGAQDALRKMLPLVFSFDQGEPSTLSIQKPP